MFRPVHLLVYATKRAFVPRRPSPTTTVSTAHPPRLELPFSTRKRWIDRRRAAAGRAGRYAIPSEGAADASGWSSYSTIYWEYGSSACCRDRVLMQNRGSSFR